MLRRDLIARCRGQPVLGRLGFARIVARRCRAGSAVRAGAATVIGVLVRSLAAGGGRCTGWRLAAGYEPAQLGWRGQAALLNDTGPAGAGPAVRADRASMMTALTLAPCARTGSAPPSCTTLTC